MAQLTGLVQEPGEEPSLVTGRYKNGKPETTWWKFETKSQDQQAINYKYKVHRVQAEILEKFN